MKRLLLLILVAGTSHAQQLEPLTVEKIMRDPKWIGVAPTNPFWGADNKTLYFNWNPDKNPGDSLYSISITDLSPKKVSPLVRRGLPYPYGTFNRARTKTLYEKNGDLFLMDIP